MGALTNSFYNNIWYKLFNTYFNLEFKKYNSLKSKMDNRIEFLP